MQQDTDYLLFHPCATCLGKPCTHVHLLNAWGWNASFRCDQDTSSASQSPDDGFLVIGENYVTNKVGEGKPCCCMHTCTHECIFACSMISRQMVTHQPLATPDASHTMTCSKPGREQTHTPSQRLDKHTHPSQRLDKHTHPSQRLDKRMHRSQRSDKHMRPSQRLDKHTHPSQRLDKRMHSSQRLDKHTHTSQRSNKPSRSHVSWICVTLSLLPADPGG